MEDIENEQSFALTEEGMENAIKLLGGILPSDLGYNFTKAVIILALFEAYLEDILTKLRHLREAYAEAAQLVEPGDPD